MNDLERAFRDALRRADTVEIPVPPIDPAELSGARRNRLPWQGILAAAAALVVVAGVGVGLLLNARGIPAAPAPGDPAEPVGATVEVELPSGAPSPVVELPASVTDELYAMLEQVAESAPHTDPRLPVEGFGGFVVTPVDEDRVGFRVQPDAVRFGPIHDYRTFTDTERVFWRFLLDAIRGSLSEEVLKEIDQAAPPVRPAGATVVVDIYSGRENPVVELDAATADELYAMVADHEAAGDLGAEASPLPGLGFRGFVVTPIDQDRPMLRVLPGSIRVGPDEADILRDPTTSFFDAIASALTPELRELVASGSVQLRVRNAGQEALQDLEVQLPSHQLITAEWLGAGETTGYQLVGQVYRYARIFASVNGEEHKLLPADYVGETPLSPGRYTYEIGVTDGGLEVKVVQDADGGWPEIPEPTRPGTPADGPEPAGDTATWVLRDPDRVTSASTEITIGVTRLDCSGGVTGEVLEPVVEYTGSRVIIRAVVAAIDRTLPQRCQGNDEVPVVVKLSEPIGDRPLVDAACLAGEAVTTSFCADGPVRWHP